MANFIAVATVEKSLALMLPYRLAYIVGELATQ